MFDLSGSSFRCCARRQHGCVRAPQWAERLGPTSVRSHVQEGVAPIATAPGQQLYAQFPHSSSVLRFSLLLPVYDLCRM